jgi:hypothetical protein
VETQQDASKSMSETNDNQNQTNGLPIASATFHQTPCGHDRETITRA